MAKRNRSRALSAILSLLRDLEDLVDSERWNLDAGALAAWQEEPWGGADVVIRSNASGNLTDGDTLVVTPFSGELSWLFEYLSQICGGILDFRNKYDFYGRLADAANKYHATREASVLHPKDLCFAVLREATRMVDEERRGGFVTRNTVTLRGVTVLLYPGAAHGGSGLAVYSHSVDAPVDLAGVPFIHQVQRFRMRHVIQRVGGEASVTCLADYVSADGTQ